MDNLAYKHTECPDHAAQQHLASIHRHPAVYRRRPSPAVLLARLFAGGVLVAGVFFVAGVVL